jgi:glutamate-ammonia-ligase adenylyltransferase
VGAQFKRIRSEILCLPRDLPTLQNDILEMRQKMHEGHINNSSLFDIKHDAGGMVDIEFLVQYLMLAYAAQFPQLTADRANLALLHEAAKLGLIETESSEAVRELYRELRRIQHQMRLNNQIPCRIEQGRIDTTPVLMLWKKLLGE